MDREPLLITFFVVGILFTLGVMIIFLFCVRDESSWGDIEAPAEPARYPTPPPLYNKDEPEPPNYSP